MNSHLLPTPRALCVALGAALLFSAGTARAVDTADPSGPYIDLGLGASHSGISGGAIDTVLANQSLATSSSVSADRTGWKFDLGYKLSPNFALELGYVDLGKENWGSNVSSGADTLNGQVHVRGPGLDLVTIAPLDESMSVYGKLGLMRASVDFSGGSSGGGGTQVLGGSDKSTIGTFGLGMGYDFTRSVGARLEWDRYLRPGDANITGRGDYDLVSASLVYRF